MKILPGRYAYRFDGFSLNAIRDEPWYLVGVGTINMEDGRVSSGYHRSTTHKLYKRPTGFTHGRFTVSGSYEWREKEGNWEAKIVLVQDLRTSPGPKQTVTSKFTMIPAGPRVGPDSDAVDRVWLISAGAEVIRDGKVPDDKQRLDAVLEFKDSEVVEGELVRIGDIIRPQIKEGALQK
eukprot:s1_g94.t1